MQKFTSQHEHFTVENVLLLVLLLSERILCIVVVDPVEGSLTVFINTVKSARVNLHPEMTEKLLQFFCWIIF